MLRLFNQHYAQMLKYRNLCGKTISCGIFVVNRAWPISCKQSCDISDVVFDIKFSFLEKVWCETRTKEYTPLSLALSCGFQHRTRGNELIKGYFIRHSIGYFCEYKVKMFLTTDVEVKLIMI